jgi:hypothetical protein
MFLVNTKKKGNEKFGKNETGEGFATDPKSVQYSDVVCDSSRYPALRALIILFSTL